VAIKRVSYTAHALGLRGVVANAKITITSRRTTDNVPGKMVPQAIDIPITSELDAITIHQPSIEFEDCIYPAKDIQLYANEAQQLYEFLSLYFNKEEPKDE
jgi:hypothetical protein